MDELERCAKIFITRAICDFGQPAEERIKAVQGVLDAVGLKATAICWPVFGGIWPQKPEGEDAEKAHEFLKDLCDTMQQGHFEDEYKHVMSKIVEARDAIKTSPKTSH